MPTKTFKAPRSSVGLSAERQVQIKKNADRRQIISQAVENISVLDPALSYMTNYLGVEINEKPFEQGAVKDEHGNPINLGDARILVWGSRIIVDPSYIDIVDTSEPENLSGEPNKYLTSNEGVRFASALAGAAMKAIGRHSFRKMAREDKRFQAASEIAVRAILMKQKPNRSNGYVKTFGGSERLAIDAALGISNSIINPANYSYGKSVEEIYRALNSAYSNSSSPKTSSGVVNAGDTVNGKGRSDEGEKGDQQGGSGYIPSDSSDDDERVAAALMSARRAGTDTDSIEEYIQASSPSDKDWRDEFRLFLGYGEEKLPDWSRPNRRYIHQDLYLPGQARHEVGVVVLAVDTSGSIDEGLLSKFMAEVNKVNQDCAPNEIHVISCDCRIQSHEVFGPYDIVEAKAVGRGGTAFSPVFRFIEKQGINPACVVYFTDLECYDFGDKPEYPVLWVKWPDGGYAFTETLNRNVPFGRVVLMDN